MKPFSPGPWTTDGSNVKAADGFGVCLPATTTIFSPTGPEWSELRATNYANMTLVTAAPDMFEVLCRVKVAIGEGRMIHADLDLVKAVVDVIQQAQGLPTK